MRDSKEGVFVDLAVAHNSNDVIEILSQSVVWNYNDPSIRSLLMSYYKVLLNNNPGKWIEIEKELVAFFNLLEYENSYLGSQDFLYSLVDDMDLRNDGFGGCLPMPDHLSLILAPFNEYVQLCETLKENGLSGYKA